MGLTKEGSVQTAAWIKATTPIVKDATIAFAEDSGVALYHFGGLSVGLGRVVGGEVGGEGLRTGSWRPEVLPWHPEERS